MAVKHKSYFTISQTWKNFEIVRTKNWVHMYNDKEARLLQNIKPGAKSKMVLQE